MNEPRPRPTVWQYLSDPGARRLSLHNSTVLLLIVAYSLALFFKPDIAHHLEGFAVLAVGSVLGRAVS